MCVAPTAVQTPRRSTPLPFLAPHAERRVKTQCSHACSFTTDVVMNTSRELTHLWTSPPPSLVPLASWRRASQCPSRRSRLSMSQWHSGRCHCGCVTRLSPLGKHILHLQHTGNKGRSTSAPCCCENSSENAKVGGAVAGTAHPTCAPPRSAARPPTPKRPRHCPPGTVSVRNGSARGVAAPRRRQEWCTGCTAHHCGWVRAAALSSRETAAHQAGVVRAQKPTLHLRAKPVLCARLAGPREGCTPARKPLRYRAAPEGGVSRLPRMSRPQSRMRAARRAAVSRRMLGGACD